MALSMVLEQLGEQHRVAVDDQQGLVGGFEGKIDAAFWRLGHKVAGAWGAAGFRDRPFDGVDLS